MFDFRSFHSAVMAHVVPCKGPDEDGVVTNNIVEDVKWLGHTKVIIKADGEPAIQALVEQVLRAGRVDCKDIDQMSKEDPAAYDSQSNGSTEVGVKMVRGMFRTLKLCLEARLGKLIPISHPIVPWLLEHACLLLNTAVRGTDGHTAWARARGRPFRQIVLGFGEKVLFRYPGKGPRSPPTGNTGALGAEGVLLGYHRSSSTFLIHTDEELVHARSIMRRPSSERWSAESLSRVRITPGSGRARAQEARSSEFGEAPASGPTAENVRAAATRELRINVPDLRKYNHYNSNCKQCQHVEKYGKAKAGLTHTSICRKEIIEKMKQTDEGRARIQDHEERVNRGLAERIEQDDAQGNRTKQGAAPPRQFIDGPEVPKVDLQDDLRRYREDPAAYTRAKYPELQPRRRAPEGVRGSIGDPAEKVLTETPISGEIITQEDMDDDKAEINDPNRTDMDTDFVGSCTVFNDLGSLEPSVDDVISSLFLQELGSSGRSYKRELRRGMKAIVSEIYSPPRITEMIKKGKYKHILPGVAMDITVNDPLDGQPWDFSLESKRQRARQVQREQKPYCLIGSPECKAFCTWQALNAAKSGNTEEMRRNTIKAIAHIDFVTELYAEQVAGGRYFLHEHPDGASSWKLPSVEAILQLRGVQRVRGDQCQYGAEVCSGMHRGDPVMKPTGFMTNWPEIAACLSARCEGRAGACSRKTGGFHRLCSGRIAREAAKYPPGLCRAVLRGIRNQMREDGMILSGCYGVQVANEDTEVMKNMKGPLQGYSGQFKDELTGQLLKDLLVREARAKELAFFTSKNVWVKVPINVAKARSGRPPISVRWVDVNKGDDVQPNCRSRLVVGQVKALDTSGASYFAPAPPLEALRSVLSLAMTKCGEHQPDWDPLSPTRTQISLIDVKRAYFNAKIDPQEPPTYVRLPEEDPDCHTLCAQLLRHMYGTRPAADGWQEEYSTMLVSLGFKQGCASPNVFYHPARKIATSVHGDVFTSEGPCDALDWLEAAIAERYEITVEPRLGPGPSDAKEGRVLNRIIRWCESHIEYEADPRQVERLISECGLQGAKAVATPSVKPTFTQLEEDVELAKHLTTAFRGAAARANYLAADRLDMQFACKEICRWMAKPTAYSWEALKRICRYLCRAPRLVYEFKQQTVDHVDVYTDTDWAGCPKTRKSTSGGCVLVGQHTVKQWSSTQASISFSSGEAEFAGVIRGAGQGLGYQALLRDFGIDLPLRVWTDSSAAIGICTRQGLGKLRHLDTHTLWIQQAVRTRRVDLRKVDGERNPADLLTKHSISRQRLEDLVEIFGCKYLGGRAESAPQTKMGSSDRVTMAQADETLAFTGQSGSGSADTELGETSPIMPHLSYSKTHLDELFPSLEAPPGDGLEDLVQDEHDSILQHGKGIANAIQAETDADGRRRRPKTEPTKPLQLLEDFPEAPGDYEEPHHFLVAHELDALAKEECEIVVVSGGSAEAMRDNAEAMRDGGDDRRDRSILSACTVSLSFS